MEGSYNLANFRYPLQQPTGVLADLTQVQNGDTLIWDSALGKFRNGSSAIPSTVVTDNTTLDGTGAAFDPLSLKPTGVLAGTYTYMSANINQYGQITSAIDGVTPLTEVAHDASLAGTGKVGDPLTVILPASTVVTSSPITGNGSVGSPVTLSNSAVTPGTYTNATVTVNNKGIVTAASAGAPPASTVTTAAPATGDGSIGSPVTLLDSTATPGTYTNATVTVDAKGIVQGILSGVPPTSTVSTASPVTGNGSIGTPVTLANSTAAAGTYTYATVTIDAKGLVQGISSGVPPSSTVNTSAPITGDGSIGTPVTLTNSTATPGTYTNATVTVDAKGLVQSIASGATPLTTVNTSSPITGNGSIGSPVALSNSTATPGTYTNATVTVDAKGLVQSISSGVPPTSTVTTDNDTIQGDGSVGIPISLKKVYTDASLTGLGTLASPLSATVSGINQQNLANLYVSSNIGNDITGNGTIGNPYLTIATALAIPPSQPTQINLTTGTYGSSGAPLSVSLTTVNTQFFGHGVGRFSVTNVYGNFTSTGTGSTVKFQRMNAYNGASPFFTWDDANGQHVIKEVRTASAGGYNSTGTFLTGTANARSTTTIEDCSLDDNTATWNIVLNNLSGGSAILYLTRTSRARVSIGTGWTVVVNNCPDVMFDSGITTSNVVFTSAMATNARVFTTQLALNNWIAYTADSAQDGYGAWSGFSAVGYTAGTVLYKLTSGGVTNVQRHRLQPMSAATIDDILTNNTFCLSSTGYVAVSTSSTTVSASDSANWVQNQTLAAGSLERIKADNIAAPAGWAYLSATNNVATGTGIYTCPKTGVYSCTIGALPSAAWASPNTSNLYIARNGSPTPANGSNILARFQKLGDSSTAAMSTSWTGRCNSGDTLQFWMNNPNAGSTFQVYVYCGVSLISV